MSNILKAHGALFLVNAFYGANAIIAKGVMPKYLSPNVFILLRVAGAVVLFWLIKPFFPKEKIDKSDWLRIAFCAVFGVAVNQLCFFHGLSQSSSINAGIIMTINPVFVVILSYFLLKEKITWNKSLGILIAGTGAILLTLTAGTGQGDSIRGDVLLFINALSYGVYLVIAKPLMKKYSPLTVITYVFTIGLIYVVIFPPTLMDLAETNFSIIPTEIIYKIAYVIICVTFLTYLLTIYGLKYLSASISSSYIYIQPVLVIIFAFLFGALGWSEDYTDTITWEKVGYMVLIIFGVALTSKVSLRKT